VKSKKSPASPKPARSRELDKAVIEARERVKLAKKKSKQARAELKAARETLKTAKRARKDAAAKAATQRPGRRTKPAAKKAPARAAAPAAVTAKKTKMKAKASRPARLKLVRAPVPEATGKALVDDAEAESTFEDQSDFNVRDRPAV
jgi:hypothetical protein